MPVTAKLSRKFYERLGEDIANELVDWFNAVDATYRNDLRELNELNFQRFDATLGQRIAELRADLRDQLAGVREGMAEARANQLKWMFAFWVATLVPLAGLILSLRVV